MTIGSLIAASPRSSRSPVRRSRDSSTAFALISLMFLLMSSASAGAGAHFGVLNTCVLSERAVYPQQGFPVMQGSPVTVHLFRHAFKSLLLKHTASARSPEISVSLVFSSSTMTRRPRSFSAPVNDDSRPAAAPRSGARSSRRGFNDVTVGICYAARNVRRSTTIHDKIVCTSKSCARDRRIADERHGAGRRGRLGREKLRIYIRVFLQRIRQRVTRITTDRPERIADPTPAFDLIIDQAIRPARVYRRPVSECSAARRRTTVEMRPSTQSSSCSA